MKALNFILSLLIFIWCIAFFWFVHSAKSFELEKRTKTDTIIVFGGSKQRLYTGAQLVKLGYAPRLFVTGNKPAEEYASFLKQMDLQPNEFIFDIEYAHSYKDYGLEAALFLKRYGIKSARLVAPSYQMGRALIEMNSNLPFGIIVIPHPVSMKKIDYNLLFIEYNKFVLMFVANILGFAHEINLSYS